MHLYQKLHNMDTTIIVEAYVMDEDEIKGEERHLKELFANLQQIS